MQSFGIVSVFSVLASIAAAYTTPVNGPIGNPIARPGLHEQVPVGKPYTITWNVSLLSTFERVQNQD